MADQEGTGEGEDIEALVHPSDGGGFWAEVVGLVGCYAQGANYTQILAKLRDAHALCSSAPSPADATVPATALELQEGATVGDLAAALTAAGWAETGEATTSHALYAHPQHGAKLCLPSDPNEPLNAGFRDAITKFLSGS